MAENGDGADNGGTEESDYRWKWLSTLWSGFYGLGFPLWVFVDVPFLVPPEAVNGFLLGALLTGWGTTVVYIVGPENVKAWREFTEAGAGE